MLSVEDATHKVELLGAKRRYIHYYKVYVIDSMNRKPKPKNYIEPMPKKQLQKIIKDFKRSGGIILMDDEAEKYLKSHNAEGSALSADIILLNKHPGRSVVYEELIHAKQYKQGKNDGSYEKRLLCEIEAQEILIDKKEELGITDEEDKQTRLALEAYEKEYTEFKNKKS